MAWNRRVVYALSDGAVLNSHQEQGDILELDLSGELAFFPHLAGVSIHDVGELHWTEPDAAIEAQFEAADSQGKTLVRVSFQDGQPVLQFAAREQ